MITSKLLAFAALALSSQMVLATNVTCQVNTTTGQLEPTRAWRNTLGADADRVCAKEQARVTAEKIEAESVRAEMSRLRAQVNDLESKQKAEMAKKAELAAAVMAASVAPVPSASTIAPAAPVVWNVFKTDKVMSSVFLRWAASAGWSYTLDNWVAPKDLPIMTDAVDEFKGDFKSAVRGLVATSELTDMSLQPCFYSNKVLRIVRISDSCARIASDRSTVN